MELPFSSAWGGKYHACAGVDLLECLLRRGRLERRRPGCSRVTSSGGERLMPAARDFRPNSFLDAPQTTSPAPCVWAARERMFPCD